MNSSGYTDVLMSWYRSQQNRGIPKGPEVVETGYNPKCGDKITFYVSDDGGAKIQILYEPQACMLCTASAEAVVQYCLDSELTPDILVQRLSSISGGLFKTGLYPPAEHTLAETLAHYPARQTCLTLPWDTLSRALKLLG